MLGRLRRLSLVRPHSPPRLQSLKVRHLLPQEQDSLLLQRGLDLCQSHQRPRHLEVRRHLQRKTTSASSEIKLTSDCRIESSISRNPEDCPSNNFLKNILYLGDGVVGYCVGVFAHLVDGSLHLFCRPGQYVAYQLFSVEAGERRRELDSRGRRVEGGEARGEGRGQGVVAW